MGTIDTLLRVRADATQAVRGLAPLQASLDETAKGAKVTEQALNELGTGTHKISLNDQAIANARDEVTRLRAQMREDLALDINADTKAAQTRIKQLQSSIKTLQQEDVVIPAKVEVDTSQLEALKGTVAAVRSGFASGVGSGVGSTLGPLAGQLFKLGSAGGEAAAGTEAAASGIAATGAASAAAVPVVGGVVAALVALSAVAVKFGQSAADVQTSVVQLQALAGDKKIGADLFEDLQKWAAATPFAIDDATAAAKQLLASGVKVKDINDDLTDMGNIAAATGAPLAQIAGIFSQMEAKGKLTTEDIQQLTDAKIPAWKALADAMGLTVEQVQELATQGKLGADSVDLLRESLAKRFPTAMSDQAKTFNGQMSTFHDTLDQVEQNIGTVFLPMMTDVLKAFNFLLGPLTLASKGMATLGDTLETKFHVGVLSTFPNIFGAASFGLDLLNGGLDDTDKKTKAATESTGGFANILTDVSNVIQTAFDNSAIDDTELSMKRLSERVQNTADAYSELLDNFTATNDAMIEARTGVFDYQGAIDDLAQSMKDNGATFSPDAEEGRKNWDALVSFAQAASTRVTDTLKNRGADAAQTVFTNARDTLHSMLVDAGVQSDKAWNLVDEVLKKPHNMQIKLDAADVKRINADLEKLRKKKRKITVDFDLQTASPVSADRAERLGITKYTALKPIQLQINADLTNKDETNAELDGLTKDHRGKDRKAQINAHVDPSSVARANADLDNIIKLRRTAEIGVRVVPPTGLPSLAAPSSFGDDRRTAAPERAPRVQVLLDGEEIAAHLKRSARQFAGTGGKRNP